MGVFFVEYKQIGKCDESGRQLTLLCNQDLDHKLHPIVIPAAELDALNWEHLSEIIRGASRSPLDMLKKRENQIESNVIKTLQANYVQALTDYRNRLNLASARDRHVISQMEAENKKVPFISAGVGCVVGGLIGTLGGVPGIVAGVIIGGGIAGGGSNELVKDKINKEGSANRKLWLGEVKLLESKRLESIEKQLRLNGRKLASDLHALEAAREVDQSMLRQAAEVQALYNTLFNKAISLEGLDCGQPDLGGYLANLRAIENVGG